MSYWIAVVDDDVTNLKIARELLIQNDIKVSVAKSGRIFLNFIKSNHPDLVLLDIRMPEMDGFEVLKNLRKYEEEEGLRKIPVIFLTADETENIESEGLALGAADFVRKPFNKDVLLRRITNILRNNQTIHNLSKDANVDKLTGFLNKASAIEEMKGLCRTEKGALILLDIDSFKLVNDVYGHDMGDNILRAFSKILKRNLRADDVVGRIGGDEFIIFGRNIPYDSVVDNIVSRINNQLAEISIEYLGEDHRVPLGVSAGAVFIPDIGGDYSDLIKQADKALSYVKKNGTHGYAVFNGEDGKTGDELTSLDSLSRLSQIMDERGEANSMLCLSQEAFISVYRFMHRYLQRYNRVAHKALFTIIPKHAEYLGSNLNGMYDAFGEMLKKHLRISDFMMRNKPNQFFVFLPELMEQDRDTVINRVLKGWKDLGFSEHAELLYEHAIVNGQEGTATHEA
ncbi:MAG: diguanylate cyclase [Lachnospiraceae bacterium]|nr:diguanylate cyclase [Lachnospiraceae bacterium]